jgi:putative transposase
VASERDLCEWLGMCRAAVRYQPCPRPRDERLHGLLARLAVALPRFGYRRIHREVLKVERVCQETIQRLWQTMALQVPRRPRRPKRIRTLAPVKGLRARHAQHVWCLDFLLDHTRDGRALRFLSVVDEYTRSCLGLDVALRFRAVDVVAVLRRLVALHGRPVFIRSDNGPEFIADDVARWAKAEGIILVRSAPASPWQNPFAETFHSRLRDELVEREDFGSLAEARQLAEAYRVWYNTERPHSALKYLTPKAFAEKMIRLALGEPTPEAATGLS